MAAPGPSGHSPPTLPPYPPPPCLATTPLKAKLCGTEGIYVGVAAAGALFFAATVTLVAVKRTSSRKQLPWTQVLVILFGVAEWSFDALFTINCSAQGADDDDYLRVFKITLPLFVLPLVASLSVIAGVYLYAAQALNEVRLEHLSLSYTGVILMSFVSLDALQALPWQCGATRLRRRLNGMAIAVSVVENVPQIGLKLYVLTSLPRTDFDWQTQTSLSLSLASLISCAVRGAIACRQEGENAIKEVREAQNHAQRQTQLQAQDGQDGQQDGQQEQPALSAAHAERANPHRHRHRCTLSSSPLPSSWLSGRIPGSGRFGQAGGPSRRETDAEHFQRIRMTTGRRMCSRMASSPSPDAGLTRTACGLERRIDPYDGGAYTMAEFRAHHGNLLAWAKAKPAVTERNTSANARITRGEETTSEKVARECHECLASIGMVTQGRLMEAHLTKPRRKRAQGRSKGRKERRPLPSQPCGVAEKAVDDQRERGDDELVEMSPVLECTFSDGGAASERAVTTASAQQSECPGSHPVLSQEKIRTSEELASEESRTRADNLNKAQRIAKVRFARRARCTPTHHQAYSGLSCELTRLRSAMYALSAKHLSMPDFPRRRSGESRSGRPSNAHSPARPRDLRRAPAGPKPSYSRATVPMSRREAAPRTAEPRRCRPLGTAALRCSVGG